MDGYERGGNAPYQEIFHMSGEKGRAVLISLLLLGLIQV